MWPDKVASGRNQEIFQAWTADLAKRGVCKRATDLAQKHLRQQSTNSKLHSQGTYHRNYRVNFQGRPDVLVRFPALGRSMFRLENLLDEMKVMSYLQEYTNIPVPPVLGFGVCDSLGPYVIVEFVDGKPLSHYLKSPEDDPLTILNPDIDLSRLRLAYGCMAEILLKLAQPHDFPAIGSFIWDQWGNHKVGKRAVTYNMNEIVEHGNVPPQELSQRHFTDATSYLVSLADDHLLHLKTQRNNAILDEEDCRKKYVNRCLFRQIARHFFKKYNKGPFMLFCDDFSPANVLVDKDFNVKAVVDWEYCYVAPAEFTFSAPWWLLLARPDMWDTGLDDFLVQYEGRLNIFLEVLRERENLLERGGTKPNTPRLSEHMARSLESGDFWVILAATSGYAFDKIFHKFIQPRYYGHIDPDVDLVTLLSAEEQRDLPGFVREKMDQKRKGVVVEHRTKQEMSEA